jgi:hypothetical protein
VTEPSWGHDGALGDVTEPSRGGDGACKGTWHTRLNGPDAATPGDVTRSCRWRDASAPLPPAATPGPPVPTHTHTAAARPFRVILRRQCVSAVCSAVARCPAPQRRPGARGPARPVGLRADHDGGPARRPSRRVACLTVEAADAVPCPRHLVGEETVPPSRSVSQLKWTLCPVRVSL